MSRPSSRCSATAGWPSGAIQVPFALRREHEPQAGGRAQPVRGGRQRLLRVARAGIDQRVERERLALDAGSLASGLDLEQQARLGRVLVTHAHMDHVGELPTLVDGRLQQDAPTLEVAGLAPTLEALRVHLFNGVLWPDFARLRGSQGPALAYHELEPEQAHALDGLSVRAVPVDHTVPSAGYLVGDGQRTLAYSGDTGPTRRFWELVQATSDLCALITEVSFPEEQRDLALSSGHLTPSMLRDQLEHVPRHRDVPLLIYGLKPAFEARIRQELDALDIDNLHVLAEGERFSF